MVLKDHNVEVRNTICQITALSSVKSIIAKPASSCEVSQPEMSFDRFCHSFWQIWMHVIPKRMTARSWPMVKSPLVSPTMALMD